jgi:hypothetical protein
VYQDRVAFRHKQAEGAKALIDALYGSQASMDALNMLDYDTFTYLNSSRQSSITLSTDQVLNGLRTSNLAILSNNDLFVRKSFDDLLTRIEEVAGLIAIRYVQWSDISALLGYYINIIRSNDELGVAIVNYAKTYGYPRFATLIGDRAQFF